MFELSVCWPLAMIDMELLHKKWLISEGKDNITAYHPRITSLENALNEHRKKNTASVTSTAQFPLPFVVETHIPASHNLAWRNETTRVLYVELRAAQDSYGLLQDEREFEEV